MATIELNNVSVSFPVYNAGNRSLKNSLVNISTGGRFASAAKNTLIVNSLSHLTFKLEHGDRLALIGHNGAGKSTLLRVLSGIYAPWQGNIKVEGEPVPLFEISLGMDMEATGYENIRIRAALLNISPSMLETLIDEIIAFTDLGNYINLPLRTYSQGMIMRLAFAVSTAINPEILLLDEWIGVGDSHFIEKAEKRLNALISRTGILVLASHNTNLLSSVCNKGIVLSHGEMKYFGEIADALKFYSAEK